MLQSPVDFDFHVQAREVPPASRQLYDGVRWHVPSTDHTQSHWPNICTHVKQ